MGSGTNLGLTTGTPATLKINKNSCKNIVGNPKGCYYNKQCHMTSFIILSPELPVVVYWCLEHPLWLLLKLPPYPPKIGPSSSCMANISIGG